MTSQESITPITRPEDQDQGSCGEKITGFLKRAEKGTGDLLEQLRNASRPKA